MIKVREELPDWVVVGITLVVLVFLVAFSVAFATGLAWTHAHLAQFTGYLSQFWNWVATRTDVDWMSLGAVLIGTSYILSLARFAVALGNVDRDYESQYYGYKEPGEFTALMEESGRSLWAWSAGIGCIIVVASAIASNLAFTDLLSLALPGANTLIAVFTIIFTVGSVALAVICWRQEAKNEASQVQSESEPSSFLLSALLGFVGLCCCAIIAWQVLR